MGLNKTKIEWADSTWNPVTGCRHGCPYCYARNIANRFGSKAGAAELHVLEEKAIHKGSGRYNPYPFGFEPTLHKYRLGDLKTKPGQTVFVCSMADLFGAWVPDEWIEQVFKACKEAPQHRYLFLTKNPTRYCQLHDADKIPQSRFVGEERRKIWYGTSLTKNHQPVWDGSIGFNTFLSIEPLLEEIQVDPEGFAFGALNWIIIGAETGNRKEKVTPKPEWVERIVKAADNRDIPVFMKDSLISVVGEENMRREFPWND